MKFPGKKQLAAAAIALPTLFNSVAYAYDNIPGWIGNYISQHGLSENDLQWDDIRERDLRDKISCIDANNDGAADKETIGGYEMNVTYEQVYKGLAIFENGQPVFHRGDNGISAKEAVSLFVKSEARYALLLGPDNFPAKILAKDPDGNPIVARPGAAIPHGESSWKAFPCPTQGQ